MSQDLDKLREAAKPLAGRRERVVEELDAAIRDVEAKLKVVSAEALARARHTISLSSSADVQAGAKSDPALLKLLKQQIEAARSLVEKTADISKSEQQLIRDAQAVLAKFRDGA